ncbi:MAG: M48 family metalloprotease [Burkholderiales bacterium]
MPVSATLRALAAIALFACLASCAINPVSGSPDLVLMSEAQEMRLGAQANQQTLKEYALYDINGLQAYVEAIGQKLAKASHRPGLSYRFTVVDSPDINAFALPGGYIYITRGILAYLNSEAELAAVLGHEIGHVTARHSVRQMSAAQGADIALTIASIFSPTLRNQGVQQITNVLGSALLSGYGRDHELEADRLGAEYLARTGYDPQAMIRVVGVLKNQELFDAEIAKQEGREPRRYHGLFASHPDNDDRFREVVNAAKKLQVSGGADDREGFLRKKEGMVFGDNAHEGLLRGGVFYHPVLGFAFRPPEGWKFNNLPDRLVIQAPGDEARLTFANAKRGNEAPADMLRRLLKRNPRDIDISAINGLQAASTSDAGGFTAVIFFKEASYVFSGAFRNDQSYRKFLEPIRAGVRTFHAITENEKSIAKPLTIRLSKAAEETRFAILAKNSPLGRSAESYLRLLNNQYPAGEPKPGQLIKIVE